MKLRFLRDITADGAKYRQGQTLDADKIPAGTRDSLIYTRAAELIPDVRAAEPPPPPPRQPEAIAKKKS